MKTNDGVRRTVRSIAPSSGVKAPTRKTAPPKSAEEESGREPHKSIRAEISREPRKISKGVVRFAGLLIVAAIFFGGVVPLISSAKIVESIPVQQIPVGLSFRAMPYAATDSFTYETITVTVNESLSVPYQSLAQVGQGARGSVRIFNESGKSIPVPAGALFIAPDGFTYRIDGPITVPARTRGGAGSVLARATAATAGTEGNRSQEDFETITTANGKEIGSLFARTDGDGFHGGAAEDNPIISKEESEGALATLRSKLDAYVLPDPSVPETYAALPGTRFSSPDRMTSVVDPEVAGNAIVTLSRDYTYVLLSVKDLTREIVKQVPVVPSAVPVEGTLVSFDGLVARISGIPTEGSQAPLTVALQGTAPIQFQLNHEKLREFVVGKPKKQAWEALGMLPWETTLSVFPPWIGKVPIEGSKIKIISEATLD